MPALITLVLLFRNTLFSPLQSPRVERFVPEWSLPQEQLPVTITVTPVGTGETTLMLKESPPHSGHSSAVAPLPAADGSNGEIRWLGRIHQPTRYSYLLRPEGAPGATVTFRGSWTTSNGTDTPTAGTTTLQLGRFHWADTNRDHVIDDREIIMVYDRYSDLPGFEEEIDRVEEIWLGVGYRWDNAARKLVILHRKREKTDEK